MIRSYRIFISNQIIKKYSLFTLIIFGIALAMGIISKTALYDAIPSYIQGIVTLFCILIVPVSSSVSLSGIYSSNVRGAQSGYNYFHSIEDSAQHFKNALIFGNILFLAALIPDAALMIGFFPNYDILIIMCFVLLALGLTNLLGFAQSTFVRILPLAMLGGCIGMYFSITEELEEDKVRSVLIVMAIVSATVYVAGIIYSVLMAKSAWVREAKRKERSEIRRENTNKAEIVSEPIPARKSAKRTKQSSFAFLMQTFARIPKWVMALLLLFTAASALLPYLAHEHIGNEDYLFPKVFLFFPAMLLIEIMMILFIGNFTANKFVRSMPIARQLYTRTLPAFLTFFSLGLPIVLTGAYFVFLTNIHVRIGQFSDTLIIAAIICGSMLFLAPVLSDNPAGGVIMIYTSSIPVVVVLVFADSMTKRFGFNIPMYLSVIIFISVAVLGTAWGFYYCSRRYRKNDGKFITVQQAIK